MKTFFLSVLVYLISFSASAQIAGDSLPLKSGNEWQMPRQALQQSRQFADSVKRVCSLDDKTTQKIFNAYLGNTKSVDEIRMGAGSAKDKQKLLSANKDHFDNVIKDILSPAQYDLYRGRK